MGGAWGPDSATTVDLRGRYDRSLTRAERSERQRLGLLRACAECIASGEDLTVERIATGAGTARNTLYVHFAGVRDLVDAFVHEAARAASTRVGSATTVETTPTAATRACATAWFQYLLEEPPRGRALRELPWSRTTSVRAVVAGATRECVVLGRQHGLLSRDPDDGRVAACVGALLEVGWRVLDGDGGAEASERWSDLVIREFR